MTPTRGPGQGLPPLAVAVLLLLLVVGACGRGAAGGPSSTDQVLRVGLVPNVAPEEQRARYEPFGDHLADALGLEVELVVASSYAGVVTALASDQLDLAYLGGLTYVQAAEQADIEPLVTEVDRDTGTTAYLSAIVVRHDAPHATVADVVAAGGTVAMGDVASTSGSLYPRVMLMRAGAACTPRDLTDCAPVEVVHTGGHDAAVQAVLQGSATAAGVELRILRRLERDGVVPAGALRVLETTEVQGYPWVARRALPTELRDRIVEAFQRIEDPALLDLLRAEGYEAVTARDYADIRARAAALGLLEEG